MATNTVIVKLDKKQMRHLEQEYFETLIRVAAERDEARHWARRYYRKAQELQAELDELRERLGG